MTQQARILGVDDDPRYLTLLKINLEAAGYKFLQARSGEEALEIAASEPVDLAILDVRMPGMDGFALIKSIREFSEVPVIFVTALGEEADKLQGLGLGADDYITKPYGPKELLARVAVVLRRYQRATTPEARVEAGDLSIDLVQHRVFCRDREVLLSPKQFQVLAYLARHLGKVVPQDQLVHDVWGPNYEDAFGGLRVCIYRIRHQIEDAPDAPSRLITFPGVGYMLQAAS